MDLFSLSASRNAVFLSVAWCSRSFFFVRKRKTGAVYRIDQSKQVKWISLGWVWLGEFWKHISINRESIHCRCLVGNCATCIVRSFSFVFFIDFCSFSYFSCCFFYFFFISNWSLWCILCFAVWLEIPKGLWKVKQWSRFNYETHGANKFIEFIRNSFDSTQTLKLIARQAWNIKRDDILFYFFRGMKICFTRKQQKSWIPAFINAF